MTWTKSWRINRSRLCLSGPLHKSVFDHVDKTVQQLTTNTTVWRRCCLTTTAVSQHLHCLSIVAVNNLPATIINSVENGGLWRRAVLDADWLNGARTWHRSRASRCLAAELIDGSAECPSREPDAGVEHNWWRQSSATAASWKVRTKNNGIIVFVGERTIGKHK